MIDLSTTDRRGSQLLDRPTRYDHRNRPRVRCDGDRLRRLAIKFIRRFWLVLRPLNSVFAHATFGVLLWLMKVHEKRFHTGFLIGSVLSVSVSVFALRTRLPSLQIRPCHDMLAATAAIILVTLALLDFSLANVLGCTPLSLSSPLVLLGIMFACFISAVFANHRF